MCWKYVLVKNGYCRKYALGAEEVWENTVHRYMRFEGGRRDLHAHVYVCVWMHACFYLTSSLSSWNWKETLQTSSYRWMLLLASQRWDFFMYYIPSLHPHDLFTVESTLLKKLYYIFSPFSSKEFFLPYFTVPTSLWNRFGWKRPTGPKLPCIPEHYGHLRPSLGYPPASGVRWVAI